MAVLDAVASPFGLSVGVPPIFLMLSLLCFSIFVCVSYSLLIYLFGVYAGIQFTFTSCMCIAVVDLSYQSCPLMNHLSLTYVFLIRLSTMIWSIHGNTLSGQTMPDDAFRMPFPSKFLRKLAIWLETFHCWIFRLPYFETPFSDDLGVSLKLRNLPDSLELVMIIWVSVAA